MAQMHTSELVTDPQGRPWVVPIKDFLMARIWETAWEEAEIDVWVDILRQQGIRNMHVLHHLDESDWALINVPTLPKRILQRSVPQLPDTQPRTPPIIVRPGLQLRKDVLEGSSIELFEGFQRMPRGATVADYVHVMDEVARAKRLYPQFPLGTEFYQKVGTSQPTYSKASNMLRQLRELGPTHPHLKDILDRPGDYTLADARKMIDEILDGKKDGNRRKRRGGERGTDVKRVRVDVEGLNGFGTQGQTT
eukprot:comp6415_c0_seq1/m.2217 comp6415_c0_seq1/g.2217  ORF comp6415_c0_seq1/g.2217 comp6415_c0_seq1/m.2217 type:complete len:250 (-) comp6415_c0_seq1:410-1159(-)